MDNIAHHTPSKRWITSAGCEWLNSLVASPAAEHGLPALLMPDGWDAGLVRVPNGRVRECFREARHMVEREINLLQAFAPAVLDQGENMLWGIIVNKTFRYGKLAEKIPLSVFCDGQTSGDTGEWLVLPSGMSATNCRKALAGLFQKGWASRTASDAYRRNGESWVYVAGPALWITSRLWHYASISAEQGSIQNSIAILTAYHEALALKWPKFLEPTAGPTEHSRVRRRRGKAATAE